MFLFNDPKSKKFRQNLRNNSPEPEKELWKVLRGRKCGGVKFRRQCSIGKYIVDFYSYERKIVVEIDGDSHYSEQEEKHDIERTQFLNSLGIKVIRFTNDNVMNNLEGCFETLVEILESRDTPLSPP